jgi:hypothetical protein
LADLSEGQCRVVLDPDNLARPWQKLVQMAVSVFVAQIGSRQRVMSAVSI